MDSFIITLREGIEAALVIGITIAFVRKAGRPELARPALLGAAGAILFSVFAALGLQSLHVAVESPVVEGSLYVIAAVAVATMVVWMLRTASQLRRGIESRLGSMISRGGNSQTTAVSLALFAFFMVAREGVETVLFVGALSLGGAGSLATVSGAIAGVGAAVLFGYLFMRGSARVDLRLFFRLTGIVLLLLAVKLAIGGVHEFEEAGIIPMSQSMAEFFDAAAASSAIDWLFLAALVVPFAAPWVRARVSRTRKHVGPSPVHQ